jgi:hypothetical protein
MRLWLARILAIGTGILVLVLSILFAWLRNH